MYTAEQSAVAEAMTAIKAAWHCDEHGTCFIDGKQVHIEINRFCLKGWASAVVGISFVLLISSLMIVLQQARQCIASDPPPTELLSSWLGVTTNMPTTKACGWSGPNVAMVATQPSSTADNTDILLQMLTSAFNMFTSAQTPAASTSFTVPVVATPPNSRHPLPFLRPSSRSAFRHLLQHATCQLMSLTPHWLTFPNMTTHLMPSARHLWSA